VQEILDNFEFRSQIPRLSKADALGTLIEKFLSPDLNVSPDPVLNGDGSQKHPGMDNHAVGTIFEELVRRFNEANNEEAGEHWTPRDAVRLMAMPPGAGKPVPLDRMVKRRSSERWRLHLPWTLSGVGARWSGPAGVS